MCPVQEPCCYVKGQVHSLHCSCIGLNETYLCPAHNFVVGPASGMVRYKDLVFHPFVRSHQGAILLKALDGGISVLWNISFLVFFSNFRMILPTKEMHTIALIILRVKNWPQRSKRFNQLLKSKI